MADLIERIEGTRFLGVELLVWLWFKSELFEGSFNRKDGSPIEVWLDSQLLLRAAADTQERVAFRGANPSATPEAKLALRSNKLPQRVKVCLRVGERDFSCVFDAESFSFGSVKIPELLSTEEDDGFLERMELIAQLDDIWMELYAEFLTLRLSTSWDRELVPAIAQWSKGKPTLSTQAYRGMLKRAK